MLRTFAAALIATSMAAGAAFAAAPTSGAGAPPQPNTAPATHAAKSTHVTKHKVAKHTGKHRRHIASTKRHGVKPAHHAKAGKTHKRRVAGNAMPPRGGKGDRLAGVNTAKLPAAKSGSAN